MTDPTGSGFFVGVAGRTRHAVERRVRRRDSDAEQGRKLCDGLWLVLLPDQEWELAAPSADDPQLCAACWWQVAFSCHAVDSLATEFGLDFARLATAIVELERQHHQRGRTVLSLAKATLHMPRAGQSSACGAGQCDHANSCPAVLICPACSGLTGPWAPDPWGAASPRETTYAPCGAWRELERLALGVTPVDLDGGCDGSRR